MGMKALSDHLNTLEPKARTVLCKRIGTTEGYIRKAASAGQLMEPARCVKTERETNGKVTRQQLRPDDWRDIWPELAGKAA